jgi:riboflavin kinase/FMN adenylyltransferase
MTARAFATEVLGKALKVIELHEGENFRFGFQAEAGIESLEELGRELGFRVRVYSPMSIRNQAVSSTRIRQLILDGSVGRARVLLGRPFSICSLPASGRGYGTRYTVPTINLAPYSELLPANGVYVTSLKVGSEETFEAVTNVGNRPTFGVDSFTVESHLLNFRPLELRQETPLRLTFLKYLRPEVKWSSPESLKEQIVRDIAKARRFFSLSEAAGLSFQFDACE